MATPSSHGDPDRESPLDAAVVFESLWPDPTVREACARRLAQSIRIAHEASEASWSVTLFPTSIRLNVGQVEVLTLREREVRVLIRTPVEPSSVADFEVEGDANQPWYRAVSVPSALCRIAPSQLHSVPTTVVAAHESFIRDAANAKRVSPFKSSFSPGILAYVEQTFGHALPRPAYRLADEAPVVRVPPKKRQTSSSRTQAWEADVQHWLARRGDVSPELATDICRFFVRAFDHTRHPQNAWFGVHKDRVSLVVGGIFLAAVLRTSRDRGFWLLLAHEPPRIEGLKHHAVKSAKHLRSPFSGRTHHRYR